MANSATQMQRGIISMKYNLRRTKPDLDIVLLERRIRSTGEHSYHIPW